MVTDNTALSCTEGSHLAVNSVSLAGLFGHAILRPHLKDLVKVKGQLDSDLPRLVIVSGRTERDTIAVANKVKTLIHTDLHRMYL